MIEEKSYYSLDKTFARIIEQQKLPPQQAQIYSKVWNSFSKWCRAQLEQDRIVLVSDTFKMSTKLIPEDNSRQYIVCLTEKILIKNSIEMEDKIDMSFPTIKFNPATISKIAEMEKQGCEIVFQSICEEIKKVISENVKDLILDIGLFGTIKIKQRKAIHQPCEKVKSSNVFGQKKTTIKSLFQKEQIPKKLPSLNQSGKLPPAESSFTESLPKLPAQKLKQPQDLQKSSLLNHSIVDKFSGTFRVPDEGEQIVQNLQSPTRRYKKHQIVLKKQMLGAGLDPLNKEQDFSVLAKTGKNLMSAHFVKPGSTATRFPPIINAFSRTLASPICSSPFPLPLPHRIGSNLSLKCVGLYIHPEKKTLIYQNTYLHGFQTTSEYKQSLATNKEEIIYGQMLLNEDTPEVRSLNYRQKKQLETKVLRKKLVFERYMSYINNQIDSSHIANIKAIWVDRIINAMTIFNEIKPFQQELPDFIVLQTEVVQEIIHSNLEEVVNDYYKAMKKSITDYVLLDQNQRKRLGIKMIFKPISYWGSEKCERNIVPYELREENAKNKQFLTSDLLLCSSATWSILNIWQIQFKQKCKLLQLPKKGDARTTIQQFISNQMQNISRCKNIFQQQFCKSVAAIYEKEIQSFNGNEYYIKKFCETNTVLLSNIVREMIYEAIAEYKQYLLSFSNPELRPIKSIIQAERLNPVHYQYENAFLIVKMVQKQGKMVYIDQMPGIKDALIKIFDQIVKVSHQLIRPESTLRKTQKQFLPEMTFEDQSYREALTSVSPALTKILQPFNALAKQFDQDYIEYFNLNHNQFVKLNPIIKKIKQNFLLINDMNDKLGLLPFYTVARMIQIDFKDLKAALVEKVDQYRINIIKWAYEKMHKNVTDLYKNIQTTIQKIKQKPKTSQKLVELQAFIRKIRKDLQKQYKNEFDQVRKWLTYLYEIDCTFTQDDYHNIHKTSTILYSLPDRVAAEQRSIDDQRMAMEQKVTAMTNQLNNDINNLLNDINQLKKFTASFEKDDANNKIDELLARISQFKETKDAINHDITTLEIGEELQFQKLAHAESLIQPYVDLWRMVRNLDSLNTNWTKTSIFKLQPEVIDKQIKSMNSKALKLNGRFISMKLNPNKSKTQAQDGPFIMLQSLSTTIKQYLKNLPLIRVFSNQGMKQRHWSQVSNYTGGVTINPQTNSNLSIKRVADFEGIFDNLNKLQQISQNAQKQFGIEKIINKMRDDWTPINVELKKWRDTGTFIVAGASIDEMQQILDDQIVKTQTMKGSPYAKIFQETIKQWEEWLVYTLSFSEYWVKVQSVWLYLQPIFSSPDIKKHLPTESADFDTVDADWKEIMAKIVDDTQVISFTKDRSFLQTLKSCQVILQKVQKGLNDYLEGKRAAFPRFYFLSNDQLLQILSETKDPTRVQPHLKKCFEGIQKLKFDQSKKVLGMFSSEGEYVNYLTIVDTNAANGNVDQWLLWTEGSMIESVKDVTTKAFQDYTKIKRKQWVKNRCGMAVLCISMTYWTYNSEAAIEGGMDSLQKYVGKLNSDLQDIVETVRGQIPSLDRCTIEALIVLDVHNRDMIKQLRDQGVTKISQFAWQSQLRYYWENNNTWVRIINATLDYNYEYLGNSSRLVITPLTDRCYRTLCGALNLNYGGAPEGPAGTGKTQTVKDLAKALARQCVVFNCSDGLDYKAMGKFFKGLASSGAWSCFDQFNRIDLEVLSVVAQQILTITIARKQGKKIFFFEDGDIPLKPTCNVFITMNPGYAGRSELPDNLKALFRAVAMMVPDYALIAQISLYSYGFSDARNLARKIVTTYTLCSEQLSSQDHYDYGMRAVKSVLTAAGNLKRKFTKQNQSILMLRAINDVNLAKFLAFDLPLFRGITSDLFPGVVLPEIDYKNMHECIDIKIKQYNLQKTDYFVMKIIQLYEMILVRHGLMVVGLPFSGKSSCIRVLQGALTLLNQRGQMNENKTLITVINPKSISMKQLYGYNDEVSHEWTDGVLAVKFRNFAKAEDPNRKWLIFDGPVDAVWIQNMNTVLDDNKKLCLNSGQIIAMSKPMNLIFEPMDLQAASPATVSRCGMVYMEPKSMGWRILVDSWINTLPAFFSQQDVKHIYGLIDWALDHLLEFIRGHVDEISPTQDQNLVKSFMKIYQSMMKDLYEKQYYDTYTDHKVRNLIIEGKFVFSLVWSIGGSADTNNRKKIQAEIKKLLSGNVAIPNHDKKKVSFPQRNSLYDFNYAPKKGGQPGTAHEWVPWTQYIDLNEKIPKNILPQQIIVKTNDSVRYSKILEVTIMNQIPLLFCGPTGTGKSCYIKNYILNDLDPSKFSSIQLGFSAQTSAMQTQDIIDGKMDRKRKGYYGPKTGKCILFVDDLNMPSKQKYGAQPPIQLLRQYLDQGGWYQHKDKEKPFRHIVDTILISAMGPPGGGRSFITPRILGHYYMLSLTSFEDETLNRIFSTILKWHFTVGQFNADILKTEPKIFASTLQIYKTAMEQFLPTPTKSHYLFNLRDFARVYFGICMSEKQKLQTQDQACRLWLHEVLRVFSDRLATEEDRLNFLTIVRQIVNRAWQLNFDKVFQHLDKQIGGKKDGKVDTLQQIRGLLWTDCMCPVGAKKVYEEVLDTQKLQQAVEEQLNNYNMTSDKPMDLVLFSFAVEHLLSISRIVKQPTGNALLVGVGGSGRQSLTKLAAQICQCQIFQIEITKTYGKLQWKDDLKKILKQSGAANTPTIFLFTDSQIKQESFVQDINNLLNTYQVPNLFPSDEKAQIMEKVRPIAKAENKLKQGTPAQLYSFFVEKCKRNLHIVLGFSPIGESFRTRVRMFPSLVNCCTIDWFQQWPQDALLWLARRFLSTIQMQDKLRQKCVEMVQYYHSSTAKWAKQFKSKLKRNYYVTPTSYIQLITTFKKLLEQKRKQVQANIFKYENGYQKIIVTEKSVEGMQKNLIQLQPKLKQAAIDTEVKMKEVSINKAEADVLKEGIQAQQAVVKTAVDEANAIKTQCEAELADAMPALRAAQNALKVLDKKQIDLLKTMKKPPNVIRVVMKALCLLIYPKPDQKFKNPDTLKIQVDWWAASMKVLNNPKLLDQLVQFNVQNVDENLVLNLGKYLNDPENVPNLQIKAVENASTACKCIMMWINGIYNFYFVNKKVKPKKAALAQAEIKVKGLNAKLFQKQKVLKQAVDKVNALNAELQSTIKYKQKLEKEYDDCSKQLERAVKLIENLGGQKGRWGQLAKQLKVSYQNLTGDILISSGLIAYLGAFTSAFRTQITSQWVKITKEKNIPGSQVYGLVSILGNPVQIRQWNIDGLPSDNFSLENGIIIFKSRRWPLCIDPQGQANKWIKKMDAKKKIGIIKLSDQNYLRTLENAIQFGQPVLLQNVGQELDPALNPILLKQTYQKGTSTFIKLGDQTIEYSSKFAFYITTKYRNPHYLPQISTKVTLINFMITYEGLNDQLLGILVKKERPDLQQEKERLILEGAANQKELFEIQQKILQVLSSDKNILMDEQAILILTASKQKSTQIKEKQQIAAITQKNIDEARQQYKPVSQQASCLFFAISDLGNIDPMYQYSLTYYIQLFTQSIAKSDKSPNLSIRLKNLKAYFLYSLYSNICRSLFEKDKLMFSFLLCTRLSEFKGQISQQLLRFLLTGGVSLDDFLPEKPKHSQWISAKNWGQMYRLSLIEKFKPFFVSVNEQVQLWKEIYDSVEPQNCKFPPKVQDIFTSFEKLLILRTIRPDKLIPAVQNYVVGQLGQKFISPPPFDLAKIYGDSTSTSPLIFILSPGSDPFASLSSFAASKKKQIKSISLGQGQGPVAQKMIQQGQKTGEWVVLQNCHLSVTWMPTLERICQQLSPDPEITKPDFRMWLTSYPSDKFPTAILQNGVKMTNQPPKGLKANLTGSYLTDPISSEQFFEGNTNMPGHFKSLIYSLSFFHAVIQERRKYGALGWNIPYQFNESDLRISVRQLKMFLDENDKIPFPALKYLTAQCNYGGRVTDDKDRRLIVTLLDDFFNLQVCQNDNYKFGPDEKFKIPHNISTHQDYLDYIQTLPHLIHPNVFGFHSNADITKDINETNLLLDSVLLCSAQSGGGQGTNAEDIIQKLIQTILGDFPEPYDVNQIMKLYPVEYKESMNTVLTQELQRFNNLIKIVRSSLKDIKLAMMGKIVMNASLQAASKSLFNGKVPELWMGKSYPSLKPLGSYVSDLKARLAFFQKWIDCGYPIVFWISGFFFTQSFLTGVLQNFARKYTIPIDEIVFDFEFLNEQPDLKPEDGAFVYGLFLQGCKWNSNKKLLDESDPKILFTKCPYILLKPSHVSKLSQYKNYKCPVYKTSARRGVLSTTGHSTNFVMYIRLPTELEERHWIKRGVALLTQLDD